MGNQPNPDETPAGTVTGDVTAGAVQVVGVWRRRLKLLAQIGTGMAAVAALVASCTSCSSLGDAGNLLGGFTGEAETAAAPAVDLDEYRSLVERQEHATAQLQWVPAAVHDGVARERDAAVDLAAQREVELAGRDRVIDQLQGEVATLEAMLDSHTEALHGEQAVTAALREACIGADVQVLDCLTAVAHYLDGTEPGKAP